MQASTSSSIIRQSISRIPRQAARQIPSHRSQLQPHSQSHPTPSHAQRSFFSLPDISKLANLAQNAMSQDTASGQVETDGDIQKYHARKILPYTQSQLYGLVADVPSYSKFIPYCTSSNVLASRSGVRKDIDEGWKPGEKEFDVEAELRVGFGGLEEKYTSRVVGRPFESVTATAAEKSGPFTSLKTTWSFSPASPLSPHATATTTPSTTPTHPVSSTNDTNPKEGPTLLTIDLAFSFANPLHRIASQAVLPRVADKMVEAFEKRCIEVWGKGKE